LIETLVSAPLVALQTSALDVGVCAVLAANAVAAATADAASSPSSGSSLHGFGGRKQNAPTGENDSFSYLTQELTGE